MGNESAEPAPKKAKKYPKILDGKYYTIRTESASTIEAICTMCQEIRKGNHSSTGNFLSHYKLKHSSMLAEVKKHLKPEIVEKNSSNQSTLHENVSTSPESVCYTIYNDRF